MARLLGAFCIDRVEEFEVESARGRPDFAQAVWQFALWSEFHDVAHVETAGPASVLKAADVDLARGTDAEADRTDET